jgi:hypothetical protein
MCYSSQTQHPHTSHFFPLIWRLGHSFCLTLFTWLDVTGPLGQGVANAVGLAVAEKHLAARFNKPDAVIVDHHT